MDENVLQAAVGEWARAILEGGWVAKWKEGAIFPCEMAYFLGYCDFLKVRRIIESGRQDGYSTAMLGLYNQKRGAASVSFDLEVDRLRSWLARFRLARWPRLKLCKGDATQWMGRELAAGRGPAAVLVDGPKSAHAVALLFAAAKFSPDVVLIASHNIDGEHYPEAKAWMLAHTIRPLFYESSEAAQSDDFRRLKEAENKICARARRSLEESSLGVIEIVSETQRLAMGESTCPALSAELQPGALVRLWQSRENG